MKPLTDSDYFFSITPKTLNNLADRMYSALSVSQSITLGFPANSGGRRAWIKFILQNPEKIDFVNKFKNYKIIECESIHYIDNSPQSFLYQLLIKFDPNTPAYESMSPNQIYTQLDAQIEQTSQNSHIIIVLIQFDSCPALSPALGSLLYSLWRAHKQKLHWVTTVYETQIPAQQEIFGPFSETMNENLFTIDPLGDDDVRHSIRHWYPFLKKEFPVEWEDKVIKYSQGSAYFSKILCHALAQHKTEDIDNLCLQTIAFIQSQKGPLYCNLETPDIFYGKRNVTAIFTPQEQEILRLLLTNEGIVTRDDISKALWRSKAFEKYSDWAIDKFVSLIRQKLVRLNFSGSIRTLRGQGYQLYQSHYGTGN